MSDIPSRLTAALADRYGIEHRLGEGGMATVYLAQDLKHGRKVAIKVLKPELAAVVGADRFLAEIQTTAQLQHPHILPLFDSGKADSFLYYVMPYVEGETLRDRLERERQFPVSEAVALAGKVASALAYAHENGILHRDIKPANILLSRGEPLVADFGIALALGAAGGGRLTETGLSLGTPYYMSPEQATGDQYVGPPSDIYALGCVLYEMLVGEPPYGGRTAQAVLGKIIAGDPVEPTRARASIPAHVDAAIRKALERLPADRFSGADDFDRALRDPSFRHGESAAPASGARDVWKPVAITASAVAVLALGLAGWFARGGEPGTRDVGLPHEAPMQVGRTLPSLAIAPDASFMVYEAARGSTTELWYRSLTGLEARPIRGTGGAFGTPVISPDGSRVAFAAGEELKVVDLETGTVTVVGEASMFTGATWLDDGRIVFADDDGRLLRWIDPESGPVREVEANYCLFPSLLGDGDRVLCGGGSWKFAFTRELADPDRHLAWTRSRDAAVPGSTVRGAHFTIVDDEYLVYISIDGALMAAPIQDLDALTVGRSVSLIPGIRRESYTGAGQYDLSEDGTLVYAAGFNAEAGRLVKVSQDGDLEILDVDTAVHLRYRESPDGQRLATVVEVVQGQELRVYDLRTGSHETVEEGFWIGAPVWSPEGSSLVYQLRAEDQLADDLLYLRRLNSPEPPRLLLSIPEGRAGIQPSSFPAPDALLVGVGTAGRPALLLDPTTDPVTVDSLPFDPLFLSFSPDRRWLARQNQGAPGVHLHPWPGLDRQYTVTQTGSEPQWLSDGQLVFYDQLARAGTQSGGAPFFRVSVDPSRDPPLGEPVLFFQDPRFGDTPGWSWAPTRDGGVIYLQSPPENRIHYVRVIPDWVTRMKTAVDEANR